MKKISPKIKPRRRSRRLHRKGRPALPRICKRQPVRRARWRKPAKLSTSVLKVNLPVPCFISQRGIPSRAARLKNFSGAVPDTRINKNLLRNNVILVSSRHSSPMNQVYTEFPDTAVNGYFILIHIANHQIFTADGQFSVCQGYSHFSPV